MKSFVNFNNIAPYYEFLSQLVFGQKIKKAQIESLKFIPTNSSVLIIGGGTGWILEEISKVHPTGLSITYIDISFKMIQLSKKRFHAFNKVEFRVVSIESVTLYQQGYDVILTPFLFDGFSQIKMELLFSKINHSLQQNGLWIYTDFYLTEKSKYWKKALIKIMYVFFRFTCNIEAKHLPDINNCFLDFELIDEKKHCNHFILSQVFEKKR